MHSTLLLVATITSAFVERLNSAMAYVNTELRCSMSQERLNDLILLYVHKDIPVLFSQIVDRFAGKVPCLMTSDRPNGSPKWADRTRRIAKAAVTVYRIHNGIYRYRKFTYFNGNSLSRFHKIPLAMLHIYFGIVVFLENPSIRVQDICLVY